MFLPAATAILEKHRPVNQSALLTTPLIGLPVYQRIGSSWFDAPEQALYMLNVNTASNQILINRGSHNCNHDYYMINCTALGVHKMNSTVYANVGMFMALETWWNDNSSRSSPGALSCRKREKWQCRKHTFPKGHCFIEMTWSEQEKGIKALVPQH